MVHDLYFDRSTTTVDGKLTLHKDGKPVFKQLAARSGQAGHTSTNWETGKSPIPFGRHWLQARYNLLQMAPKNTPFFPIATGKGQRVIWEGGQRNRQRKDIGLHKENQYKGSAGCVVIVNPDEADALFHYLTMLANAEPYLRFVVL